MAILENGFVSATWRDLNSKGRKCPASQVCQFSQPRYQPKSNGNLPLGRFSYSVRADLRRTARAFEWGVLALAG